MKRVYDMSTGRLVESVSTSDYTHRPDFSTNALQLQLQPLVSELLPERDIPPELVLVDLNTFLDKMS